MLLWSLLVHMAPRSGGLLALKGRLHTLQSLLFPVYIAPQSQCCLASALQCRIAQAALLSFGRSRGRSLHKTIKKWYDEECKIARAAQRNIGPDTHEHVAKSKSYKQLLNANDVHGNAKLKGNCVSWLPGTRLLFRRHSNE